MNRLLIVEDDPLIRRVYQKLFLKANIEAVTAEDGAIALNLLKSDCDFDLILLDIMMPNMNGFEFLGACKADNRTKGIPVSMLTNVSGRQTEVDYAKELGAYDYLVKSQYSPEELVEKVKSMLIKLGKTQ